MKTKPKPRASLTHDELFHGMARGELDRIKQMVRRGYAKFWRKRGMEPPEWMSY